MRVMQHVIGLSALAALVGLTACGGEQQVPSDAPSTPAASSTTSAGATVGTDLTPDPGGKVVVVEMISDETGNYFKPREVEVHKGDVVRYTLKVGVHNVHFLADSNAGKSGYPTMPSELLQLPGQTLDVAVRMAPGSYYFQCDPHAALGMMGHLVVK